MIEGGKVGSQGYLSLAGKKQTGSRSRLGELRMRRGFVGGDEEMES